MSQVCGPLSAVASVTMPALAATPQTPTGLHQVISTETSITFGWNPVSPVPSQIQIGHDVNGVITVLAIVAGSATEGTVYGLNAGYPETVAVRSSVLNGAVSPWSAPYVGSTPSAPPISSTSSRCSQSASSCGPPGRSRRRTSACSPAASTRGCSSAADRRSLTSDVLPAAHATRTGTPASASACFASAIVCRP